VGYTPSLGISSWPGVGTAQSVAILVLVVICMANSSCSEFPEVDHRLARGGDSCPFFSLYSGADLRHDSHSNQLSNVQYKSDS